jgi:hypothetical protein
VTEASASPRAFWRGVRPATLAGGLVFAAGAVAGVAVHPGFLLLAALGAFGPALLRETGLLHDQDEFQRQAAASAAGHGYLAGGLFVTAVLVARGSSRGMAPDPEAQVWLMLPSPRKPSSVPLPFFLLAFLSRRFPRASGAILLGLVAAGAWFFGVFRHRPDGRYLAALSVVLFLLVPLALVAISLLRARGDGEA